MASSGRNGEIFFNIAAAAAGLDGFITRQLMILRLPSQTQPHREARQPITGLTFLLFHPAYCIFLMRQATIRLVAKLKPPMRHDEIIDTGQHQCRAIFDAIPHPALIVDEDMRVQNFNREAEKMLGATPKSALWRRGGEALHCIYAGQWGCGKSPACQHCIIRTSVKNAFNGLNTRRKYLELTLQGSRGSTSVSMFITAHLLPETEFPQVLLILENLKETLRLYKQHHGL
jgi:PAS domain-containing protein